MALDGTLKYWNNGEPVIPDESLTALKYWLNGEPYTIYKAALPAGNWFLLHARNELQGMRGING